MILSRIRFMLIAQTFVLAYLTNFQMASLNAAVANITPSVVDIFYSNNLYGEMESCG